MNHFAASAASAASAGHRCPLGNLLWDAIRKTPPPLRIPLDRADSRGILRRASSGGNYQAPDARGVMKVDPLLSCGGSVGSEGGGGQLARR